MICRRSFSSRKGCLRHENLKDSDYNIAPSNLYEVPECNSFFSFNEKYSMVVQIYVMLKLKHYIITLFYLQYINVYFIRLLFILLFILISYVYRLQIKHCSFLESL